MKSPVEFTRELVANLLKSKSIAPVDSGDNTVRGYSAGDKFVRNGVLYKAKANIAINTPWSSLTSSDYEEDTALTTQINGKAPESHASSSPTYGVGSSTNYGHVKVDNALSTTSENPVQNKVVNGAIDKAKKLVASVEINPASVGHAIGTQLIYNDILYEVTTAISVNDSLVAYPTSGYNIKAVSDVSSQIQALKNFEINVKDYGAKGDGVTDDSAAFNSAIAAATTNGKSIIYVPEGVYMLSNVTLHNRYFITIKGMSRKTHLKANSVNPIFTITGDSSYITIESMWLDGATIGDGILVPDGNSINDRKSTLRFVDLFFRDCKNYCISFYAASGFDEICRCKFETNINGCIAVNLGEGFTNAALDGLCCNYFTIRECAFTNPITNPLTNADSRAIKFVNCRVVEVTGCDFTHYITALEMYVNQSLDGVHNVKIVDNKFFDNNLSAKLTRTSSRPIDNIEFVLNTVFFNTSAQIFLQVTTLDVIDNLKIANSNFYGAEPITVINTAATPYDFENNVADASWTKLYTKITQSGLKTLRQLIYDGYTNTAAGATDNTVFDGLRSWKSPSNYILLLTHVNGTRGVEVNCDLTGSNATGNITMQITNNGESPDYYYYLIM